MPSRPFADIPGVVYPPEPPVVPCPPHRKVCDYAPPGHISTAVAAELLSLTPSATRGLLLKRGTPRVWVRVPDSGVWPYWAKAEVMKIALELGAPLSAPPAGYLLLHEATELTGLRAAQLHRHLYRGRLQAVRVRLRRSHGVRFTLCYSRESLEQLRERLAHITESRAAADRKRRQQQQHRRAWCTAAEAAQQLRLASKQQAATLCRRAGVAHQPRADRKTGTEYRRADVVALAAARARKAEQAEQARQEKARAYYAAREAERARYKELLRTWCPAGEAAELLGCCTLTAQRKMRAAGVSTRPSPVRPRQILWNRDQVLHLADE